MSPRSSPHLGEEHPRPQASRSGHPLTGWLSAPPGHDSCLNVPHRGPQPAACPRCATASHRAPCPPQTPGRLQPAGPVTLLKHSERASPSPGRSYSCPRPHPHISRCSRQKPPEQALAPAPALIRPHGFSKAPRWARPATAHAPARHPAPRSLPGSSASVPSLGPRNEGHVGRGYSLVLP